MSYLSFDTPDSINHPDHYVTENFECIDVMCDVFGVEAVKQFCIANAFKYIWRHKKKNSLEDIEKAHYYLNKYICLEKHC